MGKPLITPDVEVKYKQLSQELNHIILSLIGAHSDPQIGLAVCCRALVNILVPIRRQVPEVYKTMCEQVELLAESAKLAIPKAVSRKIVTKPVFKVQ